MFTTSLKKIAPSAAATIGNMIISNLYLLFINGDNYMTIIDQFSINYIFKTK
jgi:hypothetical protein